MDSLHPCSRWFFAVTLILVAPLGMARGVPNPASWNLLLQRHVQVIDDGHASRVSYAGMRRDQTLLDGYTQSLSAVTEAQFNVWDRGDQMAFLINAYNAFTIELVLTRWPALDSIKDLGGWLSGPWKQPFFTLLGRRRNLDTIEAMLREPGRYDDPRIHFAINCASVGCPMLRPEAYAGERLDAQLEDATARFLGDRTRNRYDLATGTLRVSKLFDWYTADFRRGSAGSFRQFLAAHAAALTDAPVAQTHLRSVDIVFLPYDWRLNSAASSTTP